MKPSSTRVKIAPPSPPEPDEDERALADLSTLDASERKLAELSTLDASERKLAELATLDAGEGEFCTQPTVDARDLSHLPPEGAVATLPRGTVLGRYVLLACLGQGGMGVVYAAYDPELDRKIALKLLLNENKTAFSTEGRTRLLREAQAMARLSHPNVIAVHDVGVFDSQVFIAMEFVEGCTLRDWLGEKERAVPEILAMFSQAGRGLAAAHAQAIVHRDFKPDNVLVGKDGRVRVLDFGLARAERGEESEAQPGAGTDATLEAPITGMEATVDARVSARGERAEDAMQATRALEATLTLPGALMGTPRYMAPEQFRGQPTSARTDQFSFCVALYEALYGEAPFEGTTLADRARHVLLGEVRAEPRGRRLPVELRRALLRGLSVEQDQRFSSMEELLAAIAPRPPRSLWQRAGVPLALLVPILALGLFLGLREKPGARCEGEGAEQKLAGVWDSERKKAIEQTFLASAKPYAKDAFRGVERVLDTYTRDWVTMRTDACLATYVRGEQSEELFDLRMACLSHRLEEAREFTRLLSSADAALVERSVEAAHSLGGLEACANAAALRAPVRPPDNAETRAKVEELRAQIARIDASLVANHYVEARSEAEAVTREAEKLSYRPIEAEALRSLGKAQISNAELSEAEGTLTRALVAAEAGHHDALAAHVWIDLLSVRLSLSKLGGARESSLHASAMVERVGSGGELGNVLDIALGHLARKEGRFEEAKGYFQGALEGYEKRYGAEHPAIAAALHDLASVAMVQGNFGDAASHYERALAIKEKALGPDHPSVAASLCNLGSVLMSQGKYGEARALEQRALAIYEKAFGRDHIKTIAVLKNLANLEGDEGNYDKALELYDRVLVIEEKVYGVDHINIATTLNDMGATLVVAEKPEKAVSYLERSIAISEKANGSAHSYLAFPLTNLGDALRLLGRNEDAMKQYERALQVAEKGFGSEHPCVADALVGIGKVHLAMRTPEKAVALLERALGMREKLDEDPVLVAEARFVLARALGDDKGKDRARATRLGEEAQEAFAKAGKRSAKELREVEAWLRAPR